MPSARCSAARAGVEAIAVCLLNCFANPAHEQPDQGSDPAPRARPAGLDQLGGAAGDQGVRAHLEHGDQRLCHADRRALSGAAAGRPGAAGECAAPLLIMQSNGGLMTAEAAAARPMHVVESGPAGGVVGAHALARAMRHRRTSSPSTWAAPPPRPAIIERGEYSRALEYQVGGGIMTGSRLLTGAGYLLKVPAIDLAEVGAGGGSIVRIDRRRLDGGRPGQRGRGARPGLLRHRRHGAHDHRCEPDPRLPQPRPSGRRRSETECRSRAAASSRSRSQARSGCRSSTPPTAPTRSPPRT